MKKILALLLVSIMILGCISACDDTTPESNTESTTGPASDSESNTESNTESNSESNIVSNITKEQWQSAIATQSFENVTISYTFENDQQFLSNIVKITENGIFRQITVTINDSSQTMQVFFTGEEAIHQRNLFLGIFQALLAEKDNFVWNSEEKSYTVGKEVSTRIDYNTEDAYSIEKISKGIVKFSENGKLEYFSCVLNETIYKTDGTLLQESSGDVVWTFSNYGTTVITDDEKKYESSSTTENPDASDTSGNNASESSPLSQEQWANMISIETLKNYSCRAIGNVTQTNNKTGDVTVSNQNTLCVYTDTAASFTGTIEVISPNQETFEMSNVYTGNSFELFKKDQESAYAQILNNYEKFKYNSEKGIYDLTEPFTIQLSNDHSSTTTYVTKYDVSISTDGKLVKIDSCTTINYVDTANDTTVVSNMIYEFFDYASSVIPETVE